MRAEASLSGLLGIDIGATVHEPRGCAACGGSGYKGRIGLFEAVRVDETVRRLINAGGDETAIAAHALRGGSTLASAARALVLDGTTSPEEAIRVSRHEAADA